MFSSTCSHAYLLEHTVFSNKIAHAHFLEDTFFQIKVTHDRSLVIPLTWCSFVSRLFVEIFFESSYFSVVTNQFPHFNFEHFSCDIKIRISTSSFFTVQLNDFGSTTTTRKDISDDVNGYIVVLQAVLQKELLRFELRKVP